MSFLSHLEHHHDDEPPHELEHTPEDAAEYLEDTTGRTAEAADVPLAVPVLITEPVRTIPLAPSSWAVQTITPAVSKEVQLVAAHPQRTRLVLTNVGNQPAFLAPTRYMHDAGYQLPAGGSLELTHRGDVWVWDPVGGSVLSLSAEYATA